MPDTQKRMRRWEPKRGPIDQLIFWWKNKPQYIAIILILLVAVSTLTAIYGGNDGPDCSFEASQWQNEVSGEKMFGSQALEWQDNRVEWKRTHSNIRPPHELSRTRESTEMYEELLLEVNNAGRAALGLQGCGMDEEGLLYFDAPTSPPSDKQEECFEYHTEGSYYVRQAVKPGCHDVLANSVGWITQNFPDP